MTTDTARLLVIGAGVNGSICAVGLHNAGLNVTVLARDKRYQELQEEGIVIEDQFRHTRSTTRLPVIGSLEPADCYDYVLVVIRKNQVADLLPVLARNVSPNVVFMINNPSGPAEYISALGQEQVMLGFVFGAGRREGNVIRAIIPQGRWAVTPFGEIDGTITPRLTRLVAILRQAGFHAEASKVIADWLATHAALVVPFAMPLLKYELDIRALARSTVDLGRMVDGLRQTLDVLQAVGVRITPRSTAIIRFMPRFLWIALLRLALPSRFVEVGGVWHVSQAPDEMHQFATELQALVEKSGLPVPALRELLAMKMA
jgi:2-dehydropantoate 2-reductase